MKKLFLFFAALLLSVLAVNAANRTIYLDASDWNSSGAVYAIHVWGGAADQDVQFTNVSGDLYSVEIADDAKNAIFLRCNATNFNLSNLWNYEWNRSTTTIPSDKDKYKVTSWSSNQDSNEHGEWSVYSTGGDPEPEPEYTYTVVGSNATLFGTTWTPSLSANDMTLQGDGITYEKSYTNVHLSSDVEYKVVRNHAWGTGEFPTSGNYTLTISGEADYDVTFTYVPSTSSLTASATSLTPPTPPAPATVYAPGTFAGSWADSDPFVLDVSEEFASLTMTLAEGDYTFKIRLGSEGWRGGAGPFTRTNNSAAITGNGDDMTFTADEDGDYIFTWTYADNSLAVTYPALPTYTVALTGLESSYYVNDAVTFSASSTGVTNPTYVYYVKKGSGEYGSAVTEYTFDAADTYTIKVEVRENGAGEALATAEQAVTVDNPLTLYFVNKEGWENVNVYFYNPDKTGWPGDAMAATGDHTEGHNYAVYSYTVPASTYSSANVIFNNGSDSQTGDLDINAKHYYFDGEWYATLAECDPSTFVDFDGVAGTVLVNTPLTLAATSNVTNPGYRYYAKPVGGVYEAITSPHTFTAIGEYIIKVEALANNEGDPVASREKEIGVYTTYTFTNGTTIYVDFEAVSGDAKGVNYPKNYEADMDYDESGAGSVKTITFSTDVTWSTLSDFIKTQKAGYAGLKFTVPGIGQNCAVVAADGASYSWTTLVPPPATIQLHSDFTNPSWESSANFVLAANEETASLTMNISQGDSYEFGVLVDGVWRANGSAFDRFHASYAIPADNSANCTFAADATGEYTFTWTYETNTLSVVYPEALSVVLTGLNATQLVGDAVTVGATSNLTNVSYAYELKIGEGEYATLAANPYTFAAAGVYTFKVTATGDEGEVSATKEVTVQNPLTLYFVNKEGWSNIHAYAYGEGDVKNHNWPGELMTATADVTAYHGYAVYSILIAADTYTTAIFNNSNGGDGNQTGDMTIVPATPYYYNGAWYATLAECDPLPTVRMGGKFFSDTWADTENFAVDASGEFASITLNAVPEGDHEFKVVLGSDWRSTGGTFDRDHVSAVMTEDNQNNMILDADVAGNYTFRWIYATNTLEITYPAPPAYTVAFNGLESSYLINSEVTFSATSTGVAEPTYTYYVKQGEGEYGDAVASYTFAATGSYTVKVEVRDNGAGEALATAEKAVTVYEMITLYFINKDAWSTVAAYAYYGDGTIKNAEWPGEVITATGDVTANHGYAVYSIEVVKDKYSTIIFNDNNNGSQTGNLTIDNARPYWYDDAWYATLAECDPIHTLAFDGLEDTYIVGLSATLAATTSLTNPSFAYEVKIGEGDFAEIVGNSYQFASTGEYTFKVTATGDEGSAVATKTVNVYNPLVLYFVNKEGWANVKLYLFDPEEKSTWPGDAMTATGDHTDNHNYAVYSMVVPNGAYAQAIFNNGLDGAENEQTGDMVIDPAKQYYYDGVWYASLAECDQPVLTTDFYLVGSIIGGWDPSETYRFMKATEAATEASVTVNISSADNKEFKLKEGDAWRGATEDNVILTKDAYTVQIISDADGHNVTLTPYTSGDYVFTLNLSTRVLTVAYPGGEPMPVSNDIYLLGQMNDWTESDDYKFAVSGDVATLEVTTMEALHEYEFKLKNNGVWLGADYNFKYYWCTDVAFSAGEGNATLNTFKAGTYTFTYNLTSGELSIAFPPTSATSVAISEYEYATLYSATAFDVPNEVEAYVISAVDGTSLTMQRIYRIPANTGVILHASEGNYDFYEGDGRWMDAPTSNLLNGTLTDEVIPENGLVHYVLSYDNAFQVGFYWPTNTGANQGVGEFTNHAGKAYLEIPVQSQGQGVIARRGFPFFPSADMPTGIESQELKLESAKILHNGQLFILREGRIYNAQGARVK